MTQFHPPDSIITTATMRAAEQVALDSGISMRQLMENAGRAVAEEVIRHYAPRLTLIVCGPGNNGGDGFVVAKYLREEGWPVRVMSVVRSLDEYKGAAAEAAQEYPGEIDGLSPYGLENVELVVDALFGTGLSQPINGEIKALIDILNDIDAPKISVDMPSGIASDSGKVLGAAVEADLTVTFGRARTGHFLVPGCLNSGKVVVADIGIPEKLFLGDRIMANRPSRWMHHLQEPLASDNKFARGACLILGSGQMTGAVKLATHASRRAGAGLSIVACPTVSYPIYATTAMGEVVLPVDTHTQLKDIFEKRQVKSVLIGPGSPPDENTQGSVLRLLEDKIPLVIDGGAISAFEGNSRRLLDALHDQVIITPHEGEFSRLFPEFEDGPLGKISRVRKASEIAGCTIVMKGYDTVIADQEGSCVVNNNAPATLATAGAGDVLAGIIVGLRAHVPSAYIAAQIGVWIHGEAAQPLGEGLIAEDLISAIPRVWELLRSNSAVAI